MVNTYSYDMYTVIRGFKTFESFKTVECDPGWIMKLKAFDWRTHNFFNLFHVPYQVAVMLR